MRDFLVEGSGKASEFQQNGMRGFDDENRLSESCAERAHESLS